MFEITISSLEKLKSYLRYSEEHYAGGQGIEEQERIKTLYETTIEDYDKAIEKLKGKGEKYRTPEKVEVIETCHGFDDGTQMLEKNYLCPNCGRVLAITSNRPHATIAGHPSYCSYCGKALDWSDIKEAEDK